MKRELVIAEGELKASKILTFWRHYHIDGPEAADEVVDFYLGIEE